MNLKVGNGKVYKYEPSEGVCMVVDAQCILFRLPVVPLVHRPPTKLFTFLCQSGHIVSFSDSVIFSYS